MVLACDGWWSIWQEIDDDALVVKMMYFWNIIVGGRGPRGPIVQCFMETSCSWPGKTDNDKLVKTRQDVKHIIYDMFNAQQHARCLHQETFPKTAALIIAARRREVNKETWAARLSHRRRMSLSISVWVNVFLLQTSIYDTSVVIQAFRWRISCPLYATQIVSGPQSSKNDMG